MEAVWLKQKENHFSCHAWKVYSIRLIHKSLLAFVLTLDYFFCYYHSLTSSCCSHIIMKLWLWTLRLLLLVETDFSAGNRRFFDFCDPDKASTQSVKSEYWEKNQTVFFLFWSLTILVFVDEESSGSDDDESKNDRRGNDDDGHVGGLLCWAKNNQPITTCTDDAGQKRRTPIYQTTILHDGNSACIQTLYVCLSCCCC